MLDPTSMRVALGVVTSSMLVLFYTDIYRRTRAPFCAWWCASLALYLGASVAFVLEGAGAQQVGTPLGNVLAAAGGGAAWAAARTLNGPAPAWWQLAAGPALLAVATVLDSPQQNAWAAGTLYLGITALLMGLTAVRLWRGAGACTSPGARVMAVGAAGYSIYAACRAVVFTLLGPESRIFEIAFSSSVAALVMIVMLVTASSGMSSLSALQQAHELAVQATTDGLTGLLNRREFLRRSAAALRQSHRGRGPIALMIADLDHFKQINDRFGHSTGDRALRLFADACTAVLRPQDTVARLGGEEFGFLLPGTGADEAQRIAAEIARHVREHGASSGWGLTVSFGISALGGDTGLEEGMEYADIALYQAKRAGRDRTMLYRGA